MLRILKILIFTCSLFISQLGAAATDNFDKKSLGFVMETDQYLNNPPKQEKPIIIKISFELFGLEDISDHGQTVGINGKIKLTWKDPRNAFDPQKEGVNEKIYTGNSQVNEKLLHWYPQLVLLNEASRYETNAIFTRVQPDGTTSIIEAINASIKTRINLKIYPFDIQKFEILFGVFGYNSEEVTLETKNIIYNPSLLSETLSEWETIGVDYFTGKKDDPLIGNGHNFSTFNIQIGMKRKPNFILRTVFIPLYVIVLLSFSVFWLEIKNINERLNLSFIGLLTITGYQLVIGQYIPHVSYFTLIQGFLIISLLSISLTILMSIYLAQYIKKMPKVNYINSICKWIFPASYTLSLLLLYVFLAN